MKWGAGDYCRISGVCCCEFRTNYQHLESMVFNNLQQMLLREKALCIDLVASAQIETQTGNNLLCMVTRKCHTYSLFSLFLSIEVLESELTLWWTQQGNNCYLV